MKRNNRRPRVSSRGLLCLIAAAVLIAYGVHSVFFGWVKVPEPALTSVIEEQELREHVQFLAQPALKGRAPLSLGSYYARKHIARQFAACGLVPWGDAGDYGQSIVVGTNMVGVLPGSDAKRADEIVILSAHYDHLGRGYPGACDNASGVAALLEIAEQLSRSESRPRRSVCFAAFDREEDGLFGAVAFTCRDDYDPERIAAVVNVDMLGRKLFGTVEDTLFAGGVGACPDLRSAVLSTADGNSLRVLPFGTDLIGPRSEHAVFEPLGVPCLFFSCGICPDYHERTDTWEKLDYGATKCSADVIAAAVGHCANADAIGRDVEPKLADRDELRTFQTICAELLQNGSALGLRRKDRETGESFVKRAEELLAKPDYSVEDRRALICDGIQQLTPLIESSVLAGRGGSRRHNRWPRSRSDLAAHYASLAVDHEIWSAYQGPLMEVYQALAREILGHSLLGLAVRGIPRSFHSVDIPMDEDVVVTELASDRAHIEACPTHLIVSMNSDGLGKGGHMGFSISCAPSFCEGTPGELVDYCLLHWLIVLRDEAGEERFRESLKKMSPESREVNLAWRERWYGEEARRWRRILERVTGETHGEVFDEWLEWRLDQTDWTDLNDWLAAMLDGNHPDISEVAVHSSWRLMKDGLSGSEEWAAMHRRFAFNTAMHPLFRAEQLVALARMGGKDDLLKAAEMVADETPLAAPTIDCLYDESYPFYDHPVLKSERREREAEVESGREDHDHRNVTLGDLALHLLVDATDQDFGTDAVAWRDWIAQDYSGVPDSETGTYYPAMDNCFSWYHSQSL